MIKLEHPKRKEWLKLHRDTEHVTASQVGTIMGVNSFESPESLWYVKTGRTAPFEGNTATTLGHALESTIGKLYKKKTGHKVKNPAGAYGIVRHPDYPWLIATLDRVIEFKTSSEVATATIEIPLELKWSLNGYGFGEETMPMSYEIQLQVQMACIGATRGVLAAQVGHGELRIYERTYRPKLMEKVIEKCEEFRRLCLSNERPEFDFSHTATQSLIKELHPEDNGETIDLPDAFDELIESRWEQEIIKKEAESNVAQIDAG